MCTYLTRVAMYQPAWECTVLGDLVNGYTYVTANGADTTGPLAESLPMRAVVTLESGIETTGYDEATQQWILSIN